MSNPWLKKNPLMSLWLSGFNTIANSTRGPVLAEAQRQSLAILNWQMRQAADFWTAALPPQAVQASRKYRRK